jgi:hypothetical protein
MHSCSHDTTWPQTQSQRPTEHGQNPPKAKVKLPSFDSILPGILSQQWNTDLYTVQPELFNFNLNLFGGRDGTQRMLSVLSAVTKPLQFKKR